MSATLHITRGPTPTLARYVVCPCCEHPAHIVGSTQDYYDTIWTCCRCGDGWAGGELMPRPFRPAWRARSIKAVQLDWWDVLLAHLEEKPDA